MENSQRGLPAMVAKSSTMKGNAQAPSQRCSQFLN